MVMDSVVHTLVVEGKRILWQVARRSAFTFLLVWALGIILGLAIILERSRSLPAPSTWMFVAGVTALPATVAGQLAGALTVLLALTQLTGAILRLPEKLVTQLTTSVGGKDLPDLASWGQKRVRGMSLPASLLSALGVAVLSTLLTPRAQPPHAKPLT